MSFTALQGIGLQDARVQLDRATTRQAGTERRRRGPGVSFARAAISQMLSDGDPAELAAQRWDSHSKVVGVLKANVAGGGTPTWGDLVGSAGGQFPAGNSLTPVAASVTRVPLFTTHSRAVRVSHLTNWAVLRPNSIAYATGAAYWEPRHDR